jgi:glycosyltransferase involved in cell wall biosynthesis
MKNFSAQQNRDGGVVAISNLFPNPYEPARGLFNLRQFGALAKLVRLVTVAPIPFFPMGGWLRRFDGSGRIGRIAESGRVEELNVLYPQYFYPPVVGRMFQGRLYYRGVRGTVARAADRVKAKVLYGTWAYPDGYAVMRLADDLNLPCVIKVHGSDINDYIDIRWRRRVIVSTLNRASKVIAVSRALKRRMADNGVDESKIEVIYNGVDGDNFNESGAREARVRLGFDPSEKHILFVGNLKPVKGLTYLLEAMRRLVAVRKTVHLHIIGHGPLEASLRRKTEDLSLDSHVRFEGEKNQKDIAMWMNACDLLCLPSINEGLPNVVLEAQACGLPVVASRVGGIPEVVTADTGGMLVEPKNSTGLFEAIHTVLAHERPAREAAVRSQHISWETNSEILYSSLKSVM